MKKEYADYLIIGLLVVMLIILFFIFQNLQKEGGQCVLSPVDFLFDKYKNSTENVTCYCSAFKDFEYKDINFNVPKESYKI